MLTEDYQNNLTEREQKGYTILAKSNPKSVKEDVYLIPSQTTRKKYLIRKVNDSWICECPDFTYRKVVCKHIFCLIFWLRIKEKLKTKMIYPLTVCQFCNSNNLVKNGNRKNSYGNKQRYLCKNCNHTFVADKGFLRLKGNPQIITATLDLYFKGISLRKISDHIKQFYGISITYVTVYNWISKFVKLMTEYVDKLDPHLSDIWHADEQMVKVNGKWKWSWNIIDEQTRFLIANEITNGRDISEARKVFREAKENTSTIPEMIVTDGLHSYKKAIKKEYSSWKLPRTTHIRLRTIREKPNNNLIERFHNTFRERDKTIRGFKKTNNNITNGFQIYYNFVRGHQGLNGLTPAQLSGIDLNLNGNRWLGLIDKSINDSTPKKPKSRISRARKSYILRVFDEKGNEIDCKLEGLKKEFQDYYKAMEFIEFYKQLHPRWRFEIQ